MVVVGITISTVFVVVFPTPVVMAVIMVMIVVVIMIVVNSWTSPVRAVTIWWIVVDPYIYPGRTIIVIIVMFNHGRRTITSIIHTTSWSIADTCWWKYWRCHTVHNGIEEHGSTKSNKRSLPVIITIRTGDSKGG